MKKKGLTMLLIATVCISMVGCGKLTTKQDKNVIEQTDSKDDTKKGEKIKFDEIGLEYYMPKVWNEKKGSVSPTCVAPGKYGENYIVGQIPYEYVPFEFIKKLEKDSKKEKTEEEQKKVVETYQSKAKDFFVIMVLDKNKEKDGQKEEIEEKEKTFKNYKNHEKVAEKDNLECYLLYNDEYDENGLSDEEKKEFKEVRDGINEFKKNIKLSTPVEAKDKISDYKNVEFKAKTIDGKEIDSSIFKNSKLTMVNIWATFCGPCIEEMPDIQNLYEDLEKENINVLGIVSDTPNDENEALAKKILDKKGVKYDNIVPDESLKNGILKDLSGTPTTIFIDSNGNIVGKSLVGSYSKEEYKKAINTILK
ncbi:TlpA family protein disulfide reductase [Clostridium weizhouense]|uniref:TlpA family protein disulfide reductase n=1 Tax=Clostridium weizhouense TaxID=2859781 RepID=A0ABS7ATW2_9CLOT|nr:TlpA disulfide reductase family protein [Clostridium weizhouense]MBW6411181.1 TlpA family protein disulfide reductase [Clostridium weizhouense]